MASRAGHFRIAHDSFFHIICPYCGIVFRSTEMLHEHIEQTHGLPPPSSVKKCMKSPMTTASNGPLKVFFMQGTSENDLLDFILDKK